MEGWRSENHLHKVTQLEIWEEGGAVSSLLDPQPMPFLLHFALQGQERQRAAGSPLSSPHVPGQQRVPQGGRKSILSWIRAPRKPGTASHPTSFSPSFFPFFSSSPTSVLLNGEPHAKGMSAFDKTTADHRAGAPVDTASHSLASLTSSWVARDYALPGEGPGLLVERVCSIFSSVDMKLASKVISWGRHALYLYP